MELQQLIEQLTCSDTKIANQSLNELLAISEQSNEVYAYFNLFIEMMNHETNSYIRTRGLRLIAYNTKWDSENIMNKYIDEWLQHIEDEKPITSRLCINDTVIIAKYKPELIDVILKRLNEYHRIYNDSMQSLIYKDREKAKRQIKLITW